MDTILKALSSLKGIHYAYFSDNHGNQHSNFPVDEQAKMDNIRDIMEQLFAALEAVNKNHNETYWVLDEHMLVSFNVSGIGIFILLTERKINFPLIAMGIKSASAKIKKHKAGMAV